ncbi:hypothetical protein [Microbacterium sp. NPDC055455]
MTRRDELLRRAVSILEEIAMELRNRFSRRRVVAADGESVVSLTSYGTRSLRVYLTIESIGRGRTRPRRLLLWLDDGQILAHPPKQLVRLQRRGLEILATRDLGPHKKYFPYVTSNELSAPLVTADDDVYYSKHWLETLEQAHIDAPDDVITLRARWIRLTDSGVAPYARWSRAPLGTASPRVFPTGIGGVLYPSAVQRALRDAGDAFVDCAPRADDIWLHATTIRAGAVARQVAAPTRLEIIPVRAAGESGLWESNVVKSGNDIQATATYSADDLALLRNADASGDRRTAS